eukprot:COSAG04_NODE_659_length_11458_cov_3.404173_13_plen_109_part_00
MVFFLGVGDRLLDHCNCHNRLVIAVVSGKVLEFDSHFRSIDSFDNFILNFVANGFLMIEAFGCIFCTRGIARKGWGKTPCQRTIKSRGAALGDAMPRELGNEGAGLPR